MYLSELLHLAWEGIAKNKLRSLLTMLGVIIGVAAVIVMVAVSAGTEATISDQISSLGANLVFVSPSFSSAGPGAQRGPGPSLLYSDVQAIADNISGVAGVATERTTSQVVRAGSVSLDSISVVGTTADFPVVRDLSVASGRFISATDLDRTQKVAVLGYSLAQDLFGDSDPVGQTIIVGTTKLTVVGVMAEKGVVGMTDFDARLYIPITLAFEKYTPSEIARFAGDRVNTIYVKIADPTQMDGVITQIELLLSQRHDVSLDNPDFVVTTQQDVISTQESTTSAFRSLLAWVAAISLVVGGIGIMNIMLVSVTERTREIGIRQSVGASPGDIRRQFLTEALALSLIGGLLGVGAGIGGAWLFGQVGDLRTVVVPTSVALAFAAAAAVGIFFGFFPANKAAQLDPIEALRHE